MRILVVSDGRKTPRVLLDTKDAVGLLIQSDEGDTNCIYQISADGKSWIRYTKHEDKNFEEVAKQLGLTRSR